MQPTSKSLIGQRLSVTHNTHTHTQTSPLLTKNPNSNPLVVNERKSFCILCPVAFHFNFSWAPDINWQASSISHLLLRLHPSAVLVPTPSCLLDGYCTTNSANDVPEVSRGVEGGRESGNLARLCCHILPSYIKVLSFSSFENKTLVFLFEAEFHMCALTLISFHPLWRHQCLK